MHYTILETEFIGSAQDISFDCRGNKYGVSLSRGGCKYRDTEHEDVKYDGACSPDFADYDSAFKFYARCLYLFGQGDYDWETRKHIIVNGFEGV